jgi:hypothetical protein
MGVRRGKKRASKTGFGGNLEFGVVDFPGQICGNDPNRSTSIAPQPARIKAI